MNTNASEDPVRRPVFTGAALLILVLELSVPVACVASAVASHQQPARDIGWGQGVGAIMFFAYLLIAMILLFMIGGVLVVVANLRDEEPEWLRQFISFIYGAGVLVVGALFAWWFSPR